MYYLDLVGTLAFAIAGAFKAKGRELNIFGVLFLGAITAVGGGTFRDVIIGRTPLFYLDDQNYLLVSILGGVIVYFSPHIFKKGYSWFRLTDSVGLATFVIIGTSITHKHLFPDASSLSILAMIVSVFMGMVTGFGGGVIRDAVIGDVPYAFKKDSTYIMAAFSGAFSFYVLMFLNFEIAIASSFAITMLMREFFSKYGIYKKIIRGKKVLG
jgi:uncharacterized membrane protein YeiH